MNTNEEVQQLGVLYAKLQQLQRLLNTGFKGGSYEAEILKSYSDITPDMLLSNAFKDTGLSFADSGIEKTLRNLGAEAAHNFRQGFKERLDAEMSGILSDITDKINRQAAINTYGSLGTDLINENATSEVQAAQVELTQLVAKIQKLNDEKSKISDEGLLGKNTAEQIAAFQNAIGLIDKSGISLDKLKSTLGADLFGSLEEGAAKLKTGVDQDYVDKLQNDLNEATAAADRYKEALSGVQAENEALSQSLSKTEEELKAVKAAGIGGGSGGAGSGTSGDGAGTGLGFADELNALIPKFNELKAELKELGLPKILEDLREAQGLADALQTTLKGEGIKSQIQVDTQGLSVETLQNALGEIRSASTALEKLGNLQALNLEGFDVDKLERLAKISNELSAVGNALRNIVETLNSFKGDNGLSSVLISLNIKSSAIKNLEELSDKLPKVAEALSKFTDNNREAMAQLAAVTQNAEAMKGLSSLIKDVNKPAGKKVTAKLTGDTSAEQQKQAEKEAAAIDKVTKKLDEYYRYRNKLAQGKDLTFTQLDAYRSIEATIDDIIKKQQNAGQQSQVVLDAYTRFEARRVELDRAMRDAQRQAIDSKMVDTSQIDVAKSKVDSYETSVEAVRAKIAQLDKFKNIDILSPAEIDEWAKLNTEIDEAMRSLRSSDFKAVGSDVVEKNRAILADFERRNSKGAKDPRFKGTIEELYDVLGKGPSVDGLKEFQAGLAKLRAEMSKAGATGMSFADKWKGRMESLALYLTSFVSFYDVINQVREGLSIVREFDTNMTNLAKVSSSSAAALEEFGQASFSIADGIGAANTAVMEAASEWSRLGYNIKEASDLARTSTIYANVGEIDAETATADMVSILKGFDMETKDSMHIVDALNEVGNNFAVSSADLGEAMKRSSASLNVANTSFEKSIGLATGMTEVIQDASVAGTALKTFSARLRGSKAELEELGEDTDGMVTSTSKLRDLVMALTNVDGKGGVDIMLDPNTFKDVYDIMKEISLVWDQMTDINRSGLLEALAGRRLPGRLEITGYVYI